MYIYLIDYPEFRKPECWKLNRALIGKYEHFSLTFIYKRERENINNVVNEYYNSSNNANSDAIFVIPDMYYFIAKYPEEYKKMINVKRLDAED